MEDLEKGIVPPSDGKDRIKRARLRLESLCAKRECCEKDILQKALRALDGDEAGAQEILHFLRKDGYVSNLRYATAYAREKASLSGWGRIKITQMLRAKGVSREDIEAALSEIDPSSASSRMESALRAKWRTLKGDDNAKLKLLRFALSRGYEYDQVKDLVDRIIDEKDKDE